MGQIGWVDVGGGFRGIYAAAVLDRCLDEGVTFDLCIGVSAGSANIASFVAHQKGRNYRFYTEYGRRSRYASMRNFLFKHTFIDLDYVYATLSNSDGEDPIDQETFFASPTEVIVVAANANTGVARYFTKRDVSYDDFSILKASSAIPGVCKPYQVQGTYYFDGALGDPVPVQKAFDKGCDKVVVLLTKPRDMVRTTDGDVRLASMICRRYPAAAQALRQRAARYNEGVALAKRYERAGSVLIVAPDDTCGVSTLTRKRERLDALYAKGYGDGAVIKGFCMA